MIPVLVLAGRPNVGKSTLFNALTRTRNALVVDTPGVTRDRQYGQGLHKTQPYIVVDTGGMTEGDSLMEQSLNQQTATAIAEATAVLLIVDAHTGLTHQDEIITRTLRNTNKPLYLVVNKSDRCNIDMMAAEFYALGLQSIHIISAKTGHGVDTLIETICAEIHEVTPEAHTHTAHHQEGARIQLAIIGRPNAGKSTLTNQLMGMERVIVSDQSGTTRDSIFIPFEYQKKPFTLIDTAGLRRKTKVHDIVEKFSMIKTLKTLEQAHVCILLIDPQEHITEQDLRILRFALAAGKGLVVAINKWDALSSEARKKVADDLDRKLPFLNFIDIHTVSALRGSRIKPLMQSVLQAYTSATQSLSTPQLTRILHNAIEQNPPPRAGLRSIKLRYAHAGGKNPPRIVIHGKQTDKIPASYERYLINTFHKALDIRGTPIYLNFKNDGNPYKQ